MNEIKVFCPATIANLSCGFDVLGLCLDNVGDEMIIRKSTQKGVRITKIEGANLPLETEKNVAGVALLAMLEEVDADFGFEIEIYKFIKAGSGIGSSAASSAGAVFGANELLGKPFTRKELVKFAMQGEKLASGNAHADNVAPALLGGFTLVRSSNPLDIIKIILSKNRKSNNSLFMSKFQLEDLSIKAIIQVLQLSIPGYDSHKKNYNLKLNIFKSAKSKEKSCRDITS